MRLKSIKLAGFKSFVDPTKVPFPHALTAIVGPNGCGKSNIIDAVRWVLGEGSAKNLRGDAMTDVIFNGSLERKPISQASVELVFDNESGRMVGEFASYTEIAVKRLVNREGQNSYFLNGNRCRRRDITDLFLGTGLGPRSYAIIEQGMISRLIESKPHELRVFIEEAAGISKYKERRRETENRLKQTRDNLERLNDVREELHQQLTKLEKQAEAAQRYKTLKNEERTLKAQLAAIRWSKWQQQHDQIEGQTEQLKALVEALAAKCTHAVAKQSEQQTLLAQTEQAHSESRQKLFQLGTQITRLEQQTQHQKQQQHRAQQELAQLQAEMQEQAAYKQKLEASKAQYLHELALCKAQETESSEALNALAESVCNLEGQLQQWQQQVRHGQAQFAELRQKLSSNEHQQQLALRQKSQLAQQQTKLSQKLAELEQFQPNHQRIELKEQARALQEQSSQQQERLELALHKLEKTQQERTSLESSKQANAQQLAQVQGQIKTLLQWIPAEEQSDLSFLGLASGKPLSQCLTIESGWENCVELVLGRLAQANYLEQPMPQFNPAQLPQGEALLFQPAHTAQALENTLAIKVSGAPSLIRLLNHVRIASSESEFQRLQRQLLPHESVIMQVGVWAGADWCCTLEKSQGALAVQAELHQLEQEASLLKQQQHQRNEQLTRLDQLLKQEQVVVAQSREACAQTQQQLATQQVEFKVLAEKTESHQTQRAQLQAEQQANQLNIEALEQELTQAIASGALLQKQFDELALECETHSAEQTRLDSTLQLSRTQKDQQQQQQHQINLQRTALAHKVEGVQQALARVTQQESQAAPKREQLQQELAQSLYSAELPKALEQQLALRLTLEQECQGLHDQEQGFHQTLAELKRQEQLWNKEQQQLKEQLDALALERQTAQIRAQSAVEQLQEMEQPLEQVLASLPELIGQQSEQRWQEQLKAINRSVAQLGAVNLAAIAEFEQSAERKRYLDQQNNDLIQALELLEGAIRKIDKECKARFKETFDKVNADLKQLFPKVFEGGSAYLDLTGDDLLETGVTIMARPPGKRNATIHLLSGGEKALTALSLVFAIFRLNPAPFCLLDEVDAPLDDANVGRFCNLVREMAETVQFIYISHNKITMEMADQLAGVTMNEPGVSRLVAVDMEEAVAMAQVL